MVGEPEWRKCIEVWMHGDSGYADSAAKAEEINSYISLGGDRISAESLTTKYTR